MKHRNERVSASLVTRKSDLSKRVVSLKVYMCHLPSTSPIYLASIYWYGIR